MCLSLRRRNSCCSVRIFQHVHPRLSSTHRKHKGGVSIDRDTISYRGCVSEASSLSSQQGTPVGCFRGCHRNRISPSLCNQRLPENHEAFHGFRASHCRCGHAHGTKILVQRTDDGPTEKYTFLSFGPSSVQAMYDWLRNFLGIFPNIVNTGVCGVNSAMVCMLPVERMRTNWWWMKPLLAGVERITTFMSVQAKVKACLWFEKKRTIWCTFGIQSIVNWGRSFNEHGSMHGKWTNRKTTVVTEKRVTVYQR